MSELEELKQAYHQVLKQRNEALRKLDIAKKALELISLNKTEDCDIYTLGCDCDEEAIEALKQIEEE